MDQWAEEKIPKENKKREVRANGQVKFKTRIGNKNKT